MYFYYILKKVLIDYIQYLSNIHQETQNNFQDGITSNQDNEDEDNITNQEEPLILSTPTTTQYKTSHPKFAQFTPRSSSRVHIRKNHFPIQLYYSSIIDLYRSIQHLQILQTLQTSPPFIQTSIDITGVYIDTYRHLQT